MTGISMYSMTDSDMQIFANNVKDLLFNSLSDCGYLSGDPEKLAGEYVIVVHKPGWFGRMFDQIRKMDKLDKGYKMIVLRTIDEVEVKELPEFKE